MFDGGDHHVADVIAADAAGCCHVAHGLAVAAVEREDDAHAIAFVAADFEAIGTPAAVSLSNRDPPVMAALSAARMTLEQEIVRLHHPPEAFKVRRRRSALFSRAASQQGMSRRSAYRR